MKKALALLIVFQLFFLSLVAQTLPPVDKSPMDMSYYPSNYPVLKIQDKPTEPLTARVVYSRPQKAGRTIFGGLVKYGEIWRLGANEATEIEFFKEVSINGKKIAPGRYIIYCIPYADKWRMIFNENLYSWGLHIDKARDIADIEIPTLKNNVQIEYFTMLFQKSTYGCDLVMSWGDVKAVLPINFD